MNTPSPVLMREQPRDLGVRLGAAQVDQAACRDIPAGRRCGGCAGSGSPTLFLGVRRDERSLALPAHEQVLRSQRVDRFAHGALGNPEPRGERHLRRDRRAGRPFACLERALEQRLDLDIERLERRGDGRVALSYILYQL